MASAAWIFYAAMVLSLAAVHGSSNDTSTESQTQTSAAVTDSNELGRDTTPIIRRDTQSWRVAEVTGTEHSKENDYVSGELECYTSRCSSRDVKKCRTFDALQSVILQGCQSCGESVTSDTLSQQVLSFRSCQRETCSDDVITMSAGSMHTYLRCCNTALCNNGTMVGIEEATYNYVPNIQGVEQMEHIEFSKKGH